MGGCGGPQDNGRQIELLSLNEIFSSAICRMLLVGAVLSALPGDEGEALSLSSPGRALLEPAGRQAVAPAIEVKERRRRTNLDNLPAGTPLQGELRGVNPAKSGHEKEVPTTFYTAVLLLVWI